MTKTKRPLSNPRAVVTPRCALPDIVGVPMNLQLVLRCPFCRKRHYHGLDYGMRVSHCPRFQGQYTLVPEGTTHCSQCGAPMDGGACAQARPDA
jgi:hypothetical protein